MASHTSNPATRADAGRARELSCVVADVSENKPRTLVVQSKSLATWEIEPACLRSVAQRIHACGPRAAVEFVADLARGRPLAETVADFGRLDPALYAAVMALVCDGGHA